MIIKFLPFSNLDAKSEVNVLSKPLLVDLESSL